MQSHTRQATLCIFATSTDVSVDEHQIVNVILVAFPSSVGTRNVVMHCQYISIRPQH